MFLIKKYCASWSCLSARWMFRFHPEQNLSPIFNIFFFSVPFKIIPLFLLILQFIFFFFFSFFVCLLNKEKKIRNEWWNRSQLIPSWMVDTPCEILKMRTFDVSSSLCICNIFLSEAIIIVVYKKRNSLNYDLQVEPWKYKHFFFRGYFFPQWNPIMNFKWFTRRPPVIFFEIIVGKHHEK